MSQLMGQVEEEDQVALTRAYAKDHHLNELFVHFLQLLLYYRPNNPRTFLVQEIRKIRQQKESSSLFTETDLETMFDLIDVARRRTISLSQLKNACRNLSTTQSSSPTSSSAGGDEEDAALNAAIAEAADENGLVTLLNFKKVVSMLLVTKNVWSQ